MRVIFIGIALCFLGYTAQAAKIQWFSGAFEENGSNKKTTTSNVIGEDQGITKYVFGFASEKSNTAFVQFPLTPEKGKNAFCIEAMSKSGEVNCEVWIETKGWKFQKKIKLSAGKFKKIVLPLKGCVSNEAKWLRIAIPNKTNPQRGILLLKKPLLCSTDVVKQRTWYTGKFNKADASHKQIAEDGSAKFFWKFVSQKPAPVFLMTGFMSKQKYSNVAVIAKTEGAKPVVIQIWIESATGWKFQKKITINSLTWQTFKIKLIHIDSTQTKYIRMVVDPRGNTNEGSFTVKSIEYIK